MSLAYGEVGITVRLIKEKFNFPRLDAYELVSFTLDMVIGSIQSCCLTPNHMHINLDSSSRS